VNRTIPLSVPEKLLEEIQETARLTHLSMQDVFRQSVKIAQPLLRAGASAPEPRRTSLFDALRGGRGVLKIGASEDPVEKVTL
jgi:hypothetical protein